MRLTIVCSNGTKRAADQVEGRAAARLLDAASERAGIDPDAAEVIDAIQWLDCLRQGKSDEASGFERRLAERGYVRIEGAIRMPIKGDGSARYSGIGGMVHSLALGEFSTVRIRGLGGRWYARVVYRGIVVPARESNILKPGPKRKEEA